MEHEHVEMQSPSITKDGFHPPGSAVWIASRAAQLVGGDRQVAHGDKSVNFANTADIWTAILHAKARQINNTGVIADFRLDALDVANMLEAFKIARRYAGSHNLDDYVDGAGYAACGGEIAEHLHGER